MTDQAKSFEKDVLGGAIPSADHGDYFEIFRSFNSEEDFFDFARKLQKDSAYRPGTLKRTA